MTDGWGDAADELVDDPYDGRPLDLLVHAPRAVVHGDEGRPVEDAVVVGVRDGRVVLLEGADATDLPAAAARADLAADEVLLPAPVADAGEDGDVLDGGTPVPGPDGAGLDELERVLLGAHATGARVHLRHLSHGPAVPLLAQARAAGVRVTAEACVHHLAHDLLVGPLVGPRAGVCGGCPSTPDPADVEALWDALADGAVDMVAAPRPATEDGSPAGPGDDGTAEGTWAAVLLPLLWTAARARGHDLTDVVAWTATGPADVRGHHREGRIAVGAPARLVVVGPDDGPAGLPAWAGGRSVRGAVRRVL
ncbi:hypothetical protein [Aquipuribacter hungaricus]|uniref:Amidohydrolase family protein n=1 Tax=Aquipuribacter hungaricus TaxID=545624 RepID=A0ABV7WLG2_9MICO